MVSCCDQSFDVTSAQSSYELLNHGRNAHPEQFCDVQGAILTYVELDGYQCKICRVKFLFNKYAIAHAIHLQIPPLEGT